MFSCRQQRWKSQSCARSRGAGNAGHCWDRRCRQGSACQGTWAVIVINVDIAGNGRAGASSKCTEAGNEPPSIFKVSAVSRGSCRDGKDRTLFVRQVLPTAGSWMQTHSSRAMGWACLTACRERAPGSWKWSQFSECVSETVGDSGIFKPSTKGCDCRVMV